MSLSRLQQLKLIARCVVGDDRDAFGQLVEAYRPQVQRFLLNLTSGDAMLTDDLAQETFIKAYLGLRSFKGLSDLGTWLYRIAYNEYYGQARRAREQATDRWETLAADEGYDSVGAIDARLTVKEALARLNATERAVVTLFYIEDQSLKRIAQVTGLPEGTVKSHLHRAKARLKQFLTQN